MLVFDHIVYIQLPANMSLLNEFKCGPLDIQGIKGETDVEAEHDTGLMPDRLISPDVYEPVVLTTDEHRVAPPTDSINGPRKLTPVYTASLQLCKMQLNFLCLHLCLVVVVTLLFILMYVASLNT